MTVKAPNFGLKRWLSNAHLDILLISLLLIFFIDGWINNHKHFPLMTLFVSITTFIMILRLAFTNSVPRLQFLLLVSLGACSFYHLITYGFSFRSGSDVIYIAFFITSFYYLDKFRDQVKPNRIWSMSLVFVLMFSYGFLGMDSENWIADKSMQVVVTPDSSVPEVDATTGEIVSTIGGRIEKNRIYMPGLYRHAHVGAVLMGLCSLCFAYFNVSKNRWKQWAMMLILFAGTLMTGTRIFLAALGLALLVVAIQKRYWKIILSISIVALLSILFRYEIYQSTQHTPIGSITGALIAFVDDWRHISRLQIWGVWYQEVSSFQLQDLIYGRGLHSSLDINYVHFKRKIWFHNDLLSIFYSYGLFVFALMVLFYVQIWKRFVSKLENHTGLLLFLFILLFCSFLNGLYYYQPFFVFYLLYALEKSAPSPIWLKEQT